MKAITDSAAEVLASMADRRERNHANAITSEKQGATATVYAIHASRNGVQTARVFVEPDLIARCQVCGHNMLRFWGWGGLVYGAGLERMGSVVADLGARPIGSEVIGCPSRDRVHAGRPRPVGSGPAVSSNCGTAGRAQFGGWIASGRKPRVRRCGPSWVIATVSSIRIP